MLVSINFTKTGIIQSILSDHNGMKLEINKRRKVEIKQYKLKQWVKEDIQREIRKYLVMNENENTTPKTYRIQRM